MEERQTYISQAATAEANYQSALANLEQARINFKRTASPLAGQWLCHQSYRPARRLCQCRGPPAFCSSIPTSYWVDAYFEETALGRIREGDAATIKLMGYSPLLRGRVQGLARGINVPNAQPDASGLASVNPIFTFVRLAQRVPVRVHIDEVPEGVTLVAGLTATVQVEPNQAPPVSGSKPSPAHVSEAACNQLLVPKPNLTRRRKPLLRTSPNRRRRQRPPSKAADHQRHKRPSRRPPHSRLSQASRKWRRPRPAPTNWPCPSRPPPRRQPQPTRLPPISRRSKNRSPRTLPLALRREIAEQGRAQTRWGPANTLGRRSTFTTARPLYPHRRIDPSTRSTGAPAQGGGTDGDINRGHASAPIVERRAGRRVTIFAVFRSRTT